MVSKQAASTAPLAHMGVASERQITQTVAGATAPTVKRSAHPVEHAAEDRGRAAHARQLPVGTVENRRREEQAAPTCR